MRIYLKINHDNEKKGITFLLIIADYSFIFTNALFHVYFYKVQSCLMFVQIIIYQNLKF